MKKDHQLNLIVGLVVLLTLAILIVGVFFLNDNDPREKFNRYSLRFPQVSTLTLDDPVKVNGVKLGKVESIDLSGTKVIVQIRLRDDVRLPKDSEIRVQNIGLMGERQIGILLGDDSLSWHVGDTIPGLFDAGIAEAMGLAGEVFDSTRVLVNQVKMVVDSTFATPEFRQRIHTLLVRTEQLETRIGTLIDETDPSLKLALNRVNDAGRKVNDLLDKTQPPVLALLEDAKGLTGDTKKTIGAVDSLLNRVDSLVVRMQSKDNTMGMLLNDASLHKDLTSTIQSADSLFNTILRDGLDVNIDFF